MRLGAVDYITKPFSSVVVKARVRAAAKIARQLRMLKSQGMTDSATGLPNRSHFDLQSRIEWLRAIRRSSSLLLLLVDLVGPPPDGDLLRKAAYLLKDLLNSYSSGFLARIASARFGILLPGIDDFCAKTMTNEIRDRFRNSSLFSASGERLTTRLERYSAVPAPENSIDDLLKRVYGSSGCREFPT